MLTPTISTDTHDPGNVTAGYYLDGYRISNRPDADVTVTAWEGNDGGDDVPTWGTNPIHVQLDTNPDSRATGIVVHLNDGPPIYQGNPEHHDAATEVLREVRQALANPDTAGDYTRVATALNLIQRSGVIL